MVSAKGVAALGVGVAGLFLFVQCSNRVPDGDDIVRLPAGTGALGTTFELRVEPGNETDGPRLVPSVLTPRHDSPQLATVYNYDTGEVLDGESASLSGGRITPQTLPEGGALNIVLGYDTTYPDGNPCRAYGAVVTVYDPDRYTPQWNVQEVGPFPPEASYGDLERCIDPPAPSGPVG